MERLEEFWIGMERYWTKFERYWKILVSLRKIEGIWDRSRDIRRTLERLIRSWVDLGRVVRVCERLKGSWRDMERLEEFGRIDWIMDNAW